MSRAFNRIVITGGAGFIGSHLTDRLLEQGAQVSVIDDLSTGSQANLEAHKANNRFEFIHSKLSTFAALEKVCRDADYIFHLAAAVGVELVVNSPIKTIRTNLNETEVILEMAKTTQTPILIASTSEVYGKSNQAEFKESDDLLIGQPILGRWSYACSKLMDEFLAIAYGKEHGVETTIVRLFNTVGPRQTGRYGMVLPRFVDAALAGKPLSVYGDGEQKRCFCYVQDTVDALIQLAMTPRSNGRITNVGSQEECRIMDLAKQIVELTRSTSSIQLIPYEKAYQPGFEDMRRRRPSLENLAVLTGKIPTTSLKAIIESVILSKTGDG